MNKIAKFLLTFLLVFNFANADNNNSLKENVNINYWHGVALEVNNHINNVYKYYIEGDVIKAKKELIEAYFSKFEDKKMEAAMRMEIGSKPTWKLERLFSALRKELKKDKNIKVKKISEEITKKVTEYAKKLDAAKISPEVFNVNQ